MRISGWSSDVCSSDLADLFGLDLLGRHDPADAAEMVAVAVRKDHRLDRPLARLRLDRVGEQFPSGGRTFLRQKRIDADPAGLAADDRHNRQVLTAPLPDGARHPSEKSMQARKTGGKGNSGSRRVDE